VTEKELEKFKKESRRNYIKVNRHIESKCGTCDRSTNDCGFCNFNFSKFLMRSILPEEDGICRKCTKWLTDDCYKQGNPEKTCISMKPRKQKEQS
jgi:hypothetical protein